jgi:multiple sugar transport system permease protein
MHYANLMDDKRFWQSLAHTLILLVIALPIELAPRPRHGLLFLDRLPGKQIFIALMILPVVISPIIAGATWRLLFDNRYGPINQIVSAGSRASASMRSGRSTRPRLPRHPSAEIWQWTPFMFLMLLAGLLERRQVAEEAAELDGARFWQHLLVHHPADHQAGHRHRLPDPRPRPLSASSTSSGR